MAAIEPVDAMYYAVGVLFLLAAAWLLVFNFADRLNRVFGLYLVLEGGAILTFPFKDGTWWQSGLDGMFYWLALSAGFPLLYLAAAYRERFGRPGRRRLVLVGVLAGAAIMLWLYWLDPANFYGNGPRPFRPFHYAVILLGPSFMALLLAQDALRSRGTRRRSHLLAASVAFAFYPTAFALHLLVPGLMNPRPAEVAVAMAGLLPVASALLLILRAAARREDPHLSLAVGKYTAILALSPLSVVILALVNATTPAAGDAFMRYIMTGWLVVLVALVGYAILRHQLFGIERGLQWTIRRGTVPSLGLAVFFVVLQIVEQTAEQTQIEGFPSWLAGGIAAAAVGSLYRPLQRRVDRFATTTMPEVEASPAYTSFRKLQIYESALAAVWEDGKIGEEERFKLERLRQRLQIADQDARALEHEYGRHTVSG